MSPEEIATTMHMTVAQAKDYLAVLTQIQKFGHYDDANMGIMHQAILAEAKAQNVEPVRMALSMLFDFREEARSHDA